MIINALPFAFKGSVLWVAALIGEEIFDSLQRQMMDDPELQPMVQRLMRIHVTEEARHIQFARDGLRKRTPTMGRIPRLYVRQHQRRRRVLLPLPVHQPSAVPPRRTRRDARRAGSRAPARIAARFRSAASPRWRRSSKRSA